MLLLSMSGFTFGDPAFAWLLLTEGCWRRELPRTWILRQFGAEMRLYTDHGVQPV